MSANCFSYPYTRRYKLTHPWLYIKFTWRGIKNMFERAKKGWAKSDCWDLDSYILDTLPDMLTYLRDNNEGVNGFFKYNENDDIDTMDYHRKMYYSQMIQHFHNATEESPNAELKNEYAEEYLENIKNGIDDEETVKKYLERENFLSEWRQKEIEKAFEMMGKIFFTLWD